MAFEIERKFLIEKDLWYALKKPVGEGIIQAYLVNEPGKVVRIRVTDSKGYLTIKGPVENASRLEFEYPVPREEAIEILEHLTTKRIEKTRYKIEFYGHLWEIDEFFGDNDGLVIAETELKSREESYDKPPWLGAEVTQDHRYYNAYLSEHPFNSWK